jgi:SAM-dependent methyltransferase
VRLWARRDLVKKYATRDLRPAEVMLLARYREALSGRVLELGCGAGRLTGYLAELAAAVHAIDVSPAMLDHCRQTYPQVSFEQRDLRDLSAFEAGSFEVIVAPYNVLDVLNDDDRRRALDEARRILTPDGLLMLSSHNRAAAHLIVDSLRLRSYSPLRAAIVLARLPRWRRNRRRLLPLQRFEPGYAILNDVAHDFAALHYYITRDAQERQLAEHGFELLECLDEDGRLVEAGADAAESSELHYVARRSRSSPASASA